MSFKDELRKILEESVAWEFEEVITGDIEEALTSIINLVDKEKNTPTQIMGIPIDEVCGILTMLDMERLAEMNLTMANLHKWQELLANEQRKIFDESMRAILRGNR